MTAWVFESMLTPRDTGTNMGPPGELEFDRTEGRGSLQDDAWGNSAGI